MDRPYEAALHIVEGLAQQIFGARVCVADFFLQLDLKPGTQFSSSLTSESYRCHGISPALARCQEPDHSADHAGSLSGPSRCFHKESAVKIFEYYRTIGLIRRFDSFAKFQDFAFPFMSLIIM
jgi:hypothetical protein